MLSWFLEGQDDPPPPLPARSAVFVMRNGRYEPQNLMPIAPQPDILDFDGFVARGAAAGRPAVRPPEMRQATLVKNPVSVRRDSVQAFGADSPQGDGGSETSQESVSVAMTFDALRPCRVTVHLLVTEVEQSSDQDTSVAEGFHRHIALLPQTPAEYDACDAAGAPAWAGRMGATIASAELAAGLGQCYQSPPIDISGLPADLLAFDPGRPRDVPVAICLEPAEPEGEEVCAHYTYLSLQRVPSSPGLDPDAAGRPVQWSAQTFAQKLQYGGNCFVLYEVFGATSKQQAAATTEDGNPECVICLSEPRDTAVLPCRHMCFCSYCAGIVRLQCDRCPVCRQKVRSLLQFKRGRDSQTEGLVGAATSRRASAASSSGKVA